MKMAGMAVVSVLINALIVIFNAIWLMLTFNDGKILRDEDFVDYSFIL